MIFPRLDVSDHHQIRFKVNAKKEVEQNTALVIVFRKANYQGLRHTYWEGIRVDREEDQNIEVELHYNKIVREIHAGQEQYIPKRRRPWSNRNVPKWMNSSIRREIGLKRGLYRIIKKGEAQFVGQYNDQARKGKK